MKTQYSLFAILLFILTGCSKNYHLMVSGNDVPVFATENSSNEIVKIPAGKPFIIKGNTVKRRTIYGNHNGYTLYNSYWTLLTELNKKEVENLAFTEEKGYEYNAGSISRHPGSKKSSGGGSVSVKGYTKKNGTYVQPHTRSAPRRH